VGVGGEVPALAGPLVRHPAEAPLVDALPDATYVELARTDHAKTPKSFAFIDATLDFLRRQDQRS